MRGDKRPVNLIFSNFKSIVRSCLAQLRELLLKGIFIRADMRPRGFPVDTEPYSLFTQSTPCTYLHLRLLKSEGYERIKAKIGVG